MSAVIPSSPEQVVESAGPIRVRRMDFSFGSDIPEFWFDNNPFLTAIMLGLSVSFPPGERYFIDSVRHFQDRIDDPELKAQIRGFIGQEAMHTKEHMGLNQFMDSRGYPASGMEKFVRDRIAWIQKNSTPEENLARTAALEHLTAIIAGTFLEHPEVLERMHPTMAKVWAWHAIEEVEHRAVAFDVYKKLVDDEKLRVRTMLKVTLLFATVNLVRTLILMNVSGDLFNVKAWLKGSNLLWGKPGILRKIVPHYLAYYRRNFHPSQHEHGDRLTHARARYLGETS